MTTKTLFKLGLVVITPGIENLELGEFTNALLARHQAGDWGDLGKEDKKENELSVQEGFRIMSAYHPHDGHKLWVITEADRSVTTILLPEEY